MIYLDDLFDVGLLEEHIGNGLVTMRQHDTLPLGILKYTAECAYSRAWDKVTSQCRGLVYDTDTNAVVGRPLPKFFNYNEPLAPVFDANDPVIVMDKLDGSLITAFEYRGNMEVASSGSFHSEQAESARQMVAGGVFDGVKFIPDYTFLFELVGPSNRIVLEYPKDELVLLGAVRNACGMHFGPGAIGEEIGWAGASAKVFRYRSYGEALAAPPRPNAEGYVIKRSDGAMVKVKQEDYVNLHRLVSNLSEKSVWEAMVEGRNVDEIKQGLPEEFHGFIDETYANILTESINIRMQILEEWDKIRFLRDDRRAFAEIAKKSRVAGYLFMMLDDRSDHEITFRILKSLKPKGN